MDVSKLKQLLEQSEKLNREIEAELRRLVPGKTGRIHSSVQVRMEMGLEFYPFLPSVIDQLETFGKILEDDAGDI